MRVRNAGDALPPITGKGVRTPWPSPCCSCSFRCCLQPEGLAVGPAPAMRRRRRCFALAFVYLSLISFAGCLRRGACLPLCQGASRLLAWPSPFWAALARAPSYFHTFFFSCFFSVLRYSRYLPPPCGSRRSRSRPELKTLPPRPRRSASPVQNPFPCVPPRGRVPPAWPVSRAFPNPPANPTFIFPRLPSRT